MSCNFHVVYTALYHIYYDSEMRQHSLTVWPKSGASLNNQALDGNDFLKRHLLSYW